MHATQRLLQSHRAGAGEPLRVLAASGQLGYGIPEPALRRGLQRRPHFIGCDMGSVDPGPYYLGAAHSAAPRAMARRAPPLVAGAALQTGRPPVPGEGVVAGRRPA